MAKTIAASYSGEYNGNYQTAVRCPNGHTVYIKNGDTPTGYQCPHCSFGL